MTEDERAGLDLLIEVARGLIELTSVIRPSMFRLPYPRSLQLALDHVVLAAMNRGLPPPAGVPELLSWCRQRPVEDWPLVLPDGFLTAGALLIHPAACEPSRTCAELASLGTQSGPEQEAENLLSAIVGACATTERFAACRDFLIRRPVLLRVEPMELLQPSVAQTWKLVKGLYAPVPNRFPEDGLVHRCTGCLLLAKARTSDGPWCEGDCPPGERELESAHQPGQALALPLALRLFLALPGRTEQAMRSRLAQRPGLLPLGLGVHQIIDRQGAVRTFQVHDRREPASAALRAASVAERFGGLLDAVVPDVLAAGSAYRQGFDRALPSGALVRLLSVSEFIASDPTGPQRITHA